MECCCEPLVVKWIVIPIWSAPKGVSDINWKLPAQVQKITGVAFTLSEYEGNFPQQRIGELSLLCNDRLSHPLNFEIRRKAKVNRIDKETLTLAEPILGGTRIEGYYRNHTDIQHLLNMCLKCLVKSE